MIIANCQKQDLVLIIRKLVFLFVLLSVDVAYCQEYCIPVVLEQQDSAGNARCDLVAYWSAAKLLLNGDNPYDPQRMLEEQRRQGRIDPVPLMLWNPPWVPLFISPLTLISYSNALNFWLAGGVAIVICLTIISLRGIKRYSLFYVVASTAFVPIFESLSIAQVGVLLALGVVLTLEGLKYRKLAPVLLGAVLLSIKFHLFLFYFAILLYFVVTLFSKKQIIFLFVACLILLVTPELLRSGIYREWMGVLSDQREIYQPTTDWKTASLVTALRIWFPTLHTLLSPTKIGQVVLFVSILNFLMFFVIKPTSVEKTLTFYIIVSIVFSPYTWLSDFSILFPLQLIALRKFFEKRNSKVLQLIILLVALQGVTFLLGAIFLNAQHQYFWMPFVFGGLWVYFSSELFPKKELPTTVVMQRKSFIC